MWENFPLALSHPKYIEPPRQGSWPIIEPKNCSCTLLRARRRRGQEGLSCWSPDYFAEGGHSSFWPALPTARLGKTTNLPAPSSPLCAWFFDLLPGAVYSSIRKKKSGYGFPVAPGFACFSELCVPAIFPAPCPCP